MVDGGSPPNDGLSEVTTSAVPVVERPAGEERVKVPNTAGEMVKLLQTIHGPDSAVTVTTVDPDHPGIAQLVGVNLGHDGVLTPARPVGGMAQIDSTTTLAELSAAGITIGALPPNLTVKELDRNELSKLAEALVQFDIGRRVQVIDRSAQDKMVLDGVVVMCETDIVPTTTEPFPHFTQSMIETPAANIRTGNLGDNSVPVATNRMVVLDATAGEVFSIHTQGSHQLPGEPLPRGSNQDPATFWNTFGQVSNQPYIIDTFGSNPPRLRELFTGMTQVGAGSPGITEVHFGDDVATEAIGAANQLIGRARTHMNMQPNQLPALPTAA